MGEIREGGMEEMEKREDGWISPCDVKPTHRQSSGFHSCSDDRKNWG